MNSKLSEHRDQRQVLQEMLLEMDKNNLKPTEIEVEPAVIVKQNSVEQELDFKELFREKVDSEYRKRILKLSLV